MRSSDWRSDVCSSDLRQPDLEVFCKRGRGPIGLNFDGMKMTDTSTNPTRRGHAVELFSGFGGLSLGLEQAGFDVDIGVDVEPVNTATHEYPFSYGQSITLDLMENQSDRKSVV